MKKSVFATMVLGLVTSVPAFAQEAAHAAGGDKGLIALAAGIAIGVAALGGTLGQGKAASAAFDGIARNPAAQPKILIPMILGLALIETLVLFAFIIALQLSGKI